MSDSASGDGDGESPDETALFARDLRPDDVRLRELEEAVAADGGDEA